MTIRTIINKKMRTIMILILSGSIVFGIGCIINVWNEPNTPPIIALIGFGVAFVAMIYAFFGIRCPNCRNIIGYIAMYKGPFIPDSILKMSNKIKYCPFCGVNMDSELINK